MQILTKDNLLCEKLVKNFTVTEEWNYDMKTDMYEFRFQVSNGFDNVGQTLHMARVLRHGMSVEQWDAMVDYRKFHTRSQVFQEALKL